ncbi:tumor necrosis factor receptor superfamily member 6 [Nelusetta ayraudi]|uniref:tumor necrosis factor receptor superfamily member 6 n=1 Tax=Nelusetta ayraudi TaxID=303726 RepID=UPI003F727D9D
MADGLNAASMRIFVYILISCLVVPCAWGLCEHGTYKHDGLDCCKCDAGQTVKEHCTVGNTYGKCVHCQSETYKSVPGPSPCQLCTSCTHINAHQEEDTPCTVIKDRTCRCKEGYYCLSTTRACTVCLPCTNCDDGVKVACTQHSDTVCSLKDGSSVGIIVGVVMSLFVLTFFGIGIFFGWRKCRGRSNQEGIPEEEPMNPIPDDIDLQRLVPDLVSVIGWKDMHVIALSSGVQQNDIDNCQLGFPSDVNEQTMALLHIFIERHGRESGKILRCILLKRGLRSKAQQVESILLQDGRDNSPV